MLAVLRTTPSDQLRRLPSPRTHQHVLCRRLTRSEGAGVDVETQ